METALEVSTTRRDCRQTAAVHFLAFPSVFMHSPLASKCLVRSGRRTVVSRKFFERRGDCGRSANPASTTSVPTSAAAIERSCAPNPVRTPRR